MGKRRRHGNQAATGRGRPAGTKRAVASRVPEAPQDMLIAAREMLAGGTPFCRVDFRRGTAGARAVVQGPLVAPLARHPMAGYPLGVLRLRRLIDDSQHDAGLEFGHLYSMVYGVKRKSSDALQGMAIGPIRREFLDDDAFEEKYNDARAPAVLRQKRLRAMTYTASLVDLCVNENMPDWLTPVAIMKRGAKRYGWRYRMRDGVVPSELVAIRLQLDRFRGIRRSGESYFRVFMDG